MKILRPHPAVAVISLTIKQDTEFKNKKSVQKKHNKNGDSTERCRKKKPSLSIFDLLNESES